MAQKMQDQEPDRQGIETIKGPNGIKELWDAIETARKDTSSVHLPYGTEAELVQHCLRQASLHLALAYQWPDKREEHINAGFDEIAKARGILVRKADAGEVFLIRCELEHLPWNQIPDEDRKKVLRERFRQWEELMLWEERMWASFPPPKTCPECKKQIKGVCIYCPYDGTRLP